MSFERKNLEHLSQEALNQEALDAIAAFDAIQSKKVSPEKRSALSSASENKQAEKISKKKKILTYGGAIALGAVATAYLTPEKTPSHPTGEKEAPTTQAAPEKTAATAPTAGYTHEGKDFVPGIKMELTIQPDATAPAATLPEFVIPASQPEEIHPASQPEIVVATQPEKAVPVAASTSPETSPDTALAATQPEEVHVTTQPEEKTVTPPSISEKVKDKLHQKAQEEIDQKHKAAEEETARRNKEWQDKDQHFKNATNFDLPSATFPETFTPKSGHISGHTEGGRHTNANTPEGKEKKTTTSSRAERHEKQDSQELKITRNSKWIDDMLNTVTEQRSQVTDKEAPKFIESWLDDVENEYIFPTKGKIDKGPGFKKRFLSPYDAAVIAAKVDAIQSVLIDVRSTHHVQGYDGVIEKRLGKIRDDAVEKTTVTYQREQEKERQRLLDTR